jgi:hypothetical protein
MTASKEIEVGDEIKVVKPAIGGKLAGMKLADPKERFWVKSLEAGKGDRVIVHAVETVRHQSRAFYLDECTLTKKAAKDWSAGLSEAPKSVRRKKGTR